MALTCTLSATACSPGSGSAQSASIAPNLTQVPGPDFDVAWQPFPCSADPQGDATPHSVDLVGDATYPAAYYFHDADYVYFRYRVDGNPSGPGGFDQHAWVALMQVPSGSSFKYQYELSLDGVGQLTDSFGNPKGDAIEIWQNDQATAKNIAFNPIFNDPSDVRLYGQVYNYVAANTVNTKPLARSEPTNDGSSFGGTVDYFVDFAFPIQELVANGVVQKPSDLDLGTSLFFVATSANANNYNKDYLSCPFNSSTALSITKTVTPSQVQTDTTTPVTYTITVTNTGSSTARGVTITDTQFPSWLTITSVSATSDDPNANVVVVQNDPLDVTANQLAPGDSVTVTINANASPEANTPAFTNIASARASNAPQMNATATLTPVTVITDKCQGISCDDHNPCTDDACDPSTGQCVHANNNNACDDGDACTYGDTCGGGACAGTPITCTGDQCNARTCNGTSSCTVTPLTGGACDDGNACTYGDTCDSSGSCGGTAITCTGDQCNARSCNGTATCSETPLTGTACSDDNACTTNDVCTSNGTCAGAPVNCDDSNICTTDSCDPAKGCQYAFNTLSCDDSNACTVNDTCSNGACVGTQSGTTSSITSNFNGTALEGGDYIWFSSVFKASGLGEAPVTISVTNAHLQFSANNVAYDLPVPDAKVTFDPAVTTATTTYDAATNTWKTVLPPGGAGNTFLSGLTFPVPAAGLPGGINPVVWSGDFSSDTAGVSVNWLWAAAAYTNFSTDYNALDVKPVDDSHLSTYQNSDHAGTPEAYKAFVTGGARGGGGSNYTGSLSATASVVPATCQ